MPEEEDYFQLADEWLATLSDEKGRWEMLSARDWFIARQFLISFLRWLEERQNDPTT